MRRQDQPINAGGLRLSGATRNEFGDAAGVAGFFQIGVVIRRHHRHSQQLETVACTGARRRHGLRESVNGEEVHPHLCDLPRRPLHRRANVMQLEINEHALAGAFQIAREIEAAAIGELHADFVEGDGIAQLIDKHTRRRHAVDVERDDQPIADGIVAHAEGLPPWPALR